MMRWHLRLVSHIWTLRPIIPASNQHPEDRCHIRQRSFVRKEQFTIVIVPHNVQQAIRIADRAAFMLMGQMIEQNRATEIFENPRDERTDNYITGRFG